MAADDPAAELTLEGLDAQQHQLAANIRVMARTLRDLNQTPRAGKRAAPTYSTDTLLHWVDWLLTHYELGTTLPQCWPQHGALVEELAALYVAWLDAIPQAGSAATQWHDQLGRALARIRVEWRTSCQDGTHRPAEAAPWAQTGPTGGERLDIPGSRPLPGGPPTSA